MTPAHLLYSIHCGRGQTSSVHDVFLKNGLEDAVSFKSSVMAHGAHGHFFWSGLMFFYWN